MAFNLNAGTWQSIIRSVGLVAGGAAVYAGLISQTSLATVIDKTVQAVPVVFNFISTITPLALAIWGALAHRDAAVLAAAATVPGLAEPIKIAPDAPPAIKAVAADPAIPMVQPAGTRRASDG